MPENVITVDDIISCLRKYKDDPEVQKILLAVQHGQFSLPLYSDEHGIEIELQLGDLTGLEGTLAFPRMVKNEN